MLRRRHAVGRSKAAPLGGLGDSAIRYQHIALQFRGGIATLALSAPAQANAISPATVWELRDALAAVAANEAARALVLTAAGEADAPDFSTGFAASVLPALLDGTPDQQPPQLLASLRIPTLATLFGRVSGAALELALACDLRIGADDLSLEMAPLAYGAFPCWGGTQRLTRLVGIGRATELVLLGEAMDGAAALACGLITRLVPRATLADESQRVLDGWLRGAPLALAYAKEAVRHGGDMPLDQGLRLEWDLAVLLETTADRAEGIRAFLGKRPPQFKGE